MKIEVKMRKILILAIFVGILVCTGCTSSKSKNVATTTEEITSEETTTEETTEENTTEETTTEETSI